MDKSILTAEKEVLVAVVKMAQKQRLKGDKGDWKEFLRVHDKQMGNSISDPSKRSIHDLVSFLETFSDEQAIKFVANMVQSLSERKLLAEMSTKSAEVESPQQRLVRLTRQHPDYLLNYSFPHENEEWTATTLGNLSKAAKLNSMVAIDCEMVLCRDDTEAVVQVCVVDQNMEVRLNEFVNPNKVVADYRTEITGISAKDLDGVTCSLAHVQKKMKRLLRRGTILVGHSLHNDLRALKLYHARVIDTSYIFDTPTRRKPSLNDLSKAVLGSEVRKDGAPHNCLDDARTAMKLILAKLEGGIDDSVAWAGKDVPASESAKLLLHGIPRCVPQEELRRIFPDFTVELQPRLNDQNQQKRYSVIVILKDPKEAHKAFESIEREEEKDSFGFPQKQILFEASTGIPTSFYIRKMVHDYPHDQPTSVTPTVLEKKEDASLDQFTFSKKRSAEMKNKDELKKSRKESSQCEHHLPEIERLREELHQRDEEVANLKKIIASLTRKQGL